MLERIGDRKVVIGLMILQLIVCLPFIASFPIDLDEPFSIFWSQQSFSTLTEEIGKGNNAPLHFILLHLWIKIFGISAIAVRSLSLLFGILSIPFLYRLAQKVVGIKYALLCCLFFIFSTFMHYHSLEARMYSLMVFLSIVAIHDLYFIIFEKKLLFWRLAIVNALLFYTHFLGLYLIGTEVLLLLIFFRGWDKKFLLHFISFSLLCLLLISPYLIQFMTRADALSGGDNWVPLPNATALYGNIIRFFNYTLSFSFVAGLILIFLIISLKQKLLVIKEFTSEKKYWFVFLAFIVPYIGMFVSSYLFSPIFLDRYILFTVPFLYLFVAVLAKAGTEKLKYEWITFLLAIPLISSCYYIPQVNRATDEIATYVHEQKDEQTLVVMSPPFYDLSFMYHYDLEMFKEYESYPQNLNNDGIFGVYSYEDIHMEGCNKLIFIDAKSEFLYPGNNIRSSLDQNQAYMDSKAFKGEYAVYIYQIK